VVRGRVAAASWENRRAAGQCEPRAGGEARRAMAAFRDVLAQPALRTFVICGREVDGSSRSAAVGLGRRQFRDLIRGDSDCLSTLYVRSTL